MNEYDNNREVKFNKEMASNDKSSAGSNQGVMHKSNAGETVPTKEHAGNLQNLMEKNPDEAKIFLETLNPKNRASALGELIHGETALALCLYMTASDQTYLPLLEYILTKGGVDVNQLYESVQETGETYHLTPAHLATGLDSLELLKILVEHGADVNVKDDDSRTPLFDACKNCNLDLVQYLVESGALLDLATKKGITPLRQACVKSHLQIIQCLVQAGADVNKSTNNGFTCLMATVKRPDICEYLLENGAQPKVQNSKGKTALHIAACDGYKESVRLLMKHETDPNIQDIDGNTPLHAATAMGHLEIVKMLLDSGVHINTQDISGCTALHNAVEYGHKEVVDVLLQHGADPLINNAEKKDCFRLAANCNHEEIQKALEQAVDK